jgi:hypothetical protein
MRSCVTRRFTIGVFPDGSSDPPVVRFRDTHGGCGCGAMAEVAPHSGDRTVRRPVLETSLSTEQQERRHAVATARVTGV